MKLKDTRKFIETDHIIFEVNDREILAEFMLDYAILEEDDIVFEENQEFSILINTIPNWFSFDDIDRFKREQLALFKACKFDLSGVLELKSTDGVGILRSLFKGFTSAFNWEKKYFVLKGVKLYIY